MQHSTYLTNKIIDIRAILPLCRYIYSADRLNAHFSDRYDKRNVHAILSIYNIPLYNCNKKISN